MNLLVVELLLVIVAGLFTSTVQQYLLYRNKGSYSSSQTKFQTVS